MPLARYGQTAGDGLQLHDKTAGKRQTNSSAEQSLTVDDFFGLHSGVYSQRGDDDPFFSIALMVKYRSGSKGDIQQ